MSHSNFRRRLGGQLCPIIVVSVFAVAYALVMSSVTILRHLSFNSFAFDLGIFDELLWNTLQGKVLYSSILGVRHFFSEHFSPILLLFVPFYWLYASPTLLLVLQSCALASGAIPIYQLARKKLDSEGLGILFSSLYLCYQPLRNVNLYDFHPIAFATPLLLFAFLFIEQKRYGKFALLLTLALLCKEEMALIVVIFGLYITIVQKNSKLGIPLAGGGVLAFAVILGVIIPFYREGAAFAFLHRYGYLGQSIPEILRTLLFHPIYVLEHILIPEKFFYFLNTFGPVGFLSLLSPSHLLLTVPTFFQNMLSDFPPQYSIKFQYSAPLTPFVFISAIYGLRNVFAIVCHSPRLRVTLTQRRMALLASAVLVLCTGIFFGPFRTYRISEHSRLAHQLIELIPPTASVSAQESYLPHLVQRDESYLFPKVSGAEYIFLDLASRFKGSIKESAYFQKLDKLLQQEYGVLAYEEYLLVLKKGYSQEKNKQVFRLSPRFGVHSIDGALLPSKVGTIEGRARVAREGQTPRGFLTYGPYFQYSQGNYQVTITYSTAGIASGEEIARWNIGFIGQDGLETLRKGALVSSLGNEEGKVVEEIVISDRHHMRPLEVWIYYEGKGDLILRNIMIELSL